MGLKQTARSTSEASGWEGRYPTCRSPPLRRSCTSCPRRGRTSLPSLQPRGAPAQGAAAERTRAPRGLLRLRRPQPPPSTAPPVPRRLGRSCVTPAAEVVRRRGAGMVSAVWAEAPAPALRLRDPVHAADIDCSPVVRPAAGQKPFCWAPSLCPTPGASVGSPPHLFLSRALPAGHTLTAKPPPVKGGERLGVKTPVKVGEKRKASDETPYQAKVRVRTGVRPGAVRPHGPDALHLNTES